MTVTFARICVFTGALTLAALWLHAQPVQVDAPVPPAQPGQPVPPHLTQFQDPTQPVYIEDSPAAQELADEALELREQGRTADAAQRLQRLIDEYPFKLMPTAEGAYTDTVLWVRTQFIADPELLETYRALFGPAAARDVAQAMPTAEQPIDTEKLRDVLTRHTLTPAGLDAGLALGAYHLERAEGRDASSVLDELIAHPDLPAHKGRYHFQRALAGLLLSDAAELQHHRRALAELADSSFLNDLDQLSNRMHPKLRFQHEPLTPASNTLSLPTSLKDPLWEVRYAPELPEAVTNRPNLRGVPAGQSLLRVIPSGDPKRIYLNLGNTVSAYDRVSGWHLWELAPTSAQPDMAQALNQRILTEPRGVLVSGSRAFTLLGWNNPRRPLPPEAGDRVGLVSIETATGKERWRVVPAALDPSLEKTTFDGTPIGGDGRVYTLAKRVQVSGLHDLYLTAVSEDDGRLLWRRHIASSSSQGNYNTGPLPRMILHGGRVYVTDNRGTVCALDGPSGTVRWLTFLPGAGEINPGARRAVTPVKDLPFPVMSRAGLLVPPIVANGSHQLLDTRTGKILRELADDEWSNVRACYAANGDVLAIGRGVTCFDGDTLNPRWHTPMPPAMFGSIQGRPAVDVSMPAQPQNASPADPPAPGVVVLNTDRRLVALSLADGTILADDPHDAPGNVMLAPGQIVIANVDHLVAYTDWPIAHNQLTYRAAKNPADPQPGLALARLALHTGHDADVLQGIDLAIAAIEPAPGEPLTDPAIQQSVFNPLRDIINPDSGADIQLRGELLDRMAAATTNPEQEAAYQITRGMYLEELGEPARAVEHYQSVLADTSLANELYAQGRGSIRAGLQAHRRLKALIHTHTRIIYSEYDLLAEHELGELNALGETDPTRFTELADRYPLALVANDARTLAADRYQQQGNLAAALKQWQTVYLNTDATERLSTSAGHITLMYLQQDRPDLARRWLRRVNREHPGLLLTRDDQPVSIPSWVSELSAQLASARALPRLSLPLSEPTLIPGRPIPAQFPGETPPRDTVLMRDQNDFWMLSSQDFNELWRKPIPAYDVRTLTADQRQVLWWSREAGRLGALDPHTGEPLWDDIDIAAALDKAGSTHQRRDRTRQQMQFVQILGGVDGRNIRNIPNDPNASLMTTVDLTTVILADRFGRIVCIDRDTGRVRWRRVSPTDNLTAVTLGDGLVAISGANWADTQVQHGVVTLLDILTGEPLETQIQSDVIPNWLGFTDHGQLVLASNNKLLCYDPVSGRTRWTHQVPRTAAIRKVWLGGRLLIASTFQSQAGSALVMDQDTGELINQLAIRSTVAHARTIDALEADGQWHVFTPMQATAIDHTGRTTWADAISAPIGHILMQHLSEQYVCLVGQTGNQEIPILPQGHLAGRLELEQAIRNAVLAGQLRVNDGSYKLYILDRRTGLIRSEAPLDRVPSPIDPAASTLLDGALILGAGDQSLLIRSQSSLD